MINSFSDNVVFSLNIRYRGYNIVFDTCVRYDEYYVMTIGGPLVYILELIEMSSSCFGIFVFDRIKGKIIRKCIH